MSASERSARARSNLVTAVADAFLDRAPLVALTGQGDLERMHKESHQYIDLLRVMRPITKWNARLTDAAIVPEVVRKAFKVAEGEKPGATHIELPEDVMAAAIDAEPLPRSAPGAAGAGRARAAEGRRPRSAARITPGRARRQRRRARAARRRRCASSCAPRASRSPRRSWARACCRPTTPRRSARSASRRATTAMAGFDEADVVLAIGYDLVEHSPEHWNPRRDKKIICIDSVPAEIDEYFIPEVELIGDIYHVLSRLGEECRHVPHTGGSTACATSCWAASSRPRTTTHFPVQPPRALYEIRQALGREDILISDVGLHKLWIGRMFPAYEPNTVLIANGLAGMGFALPAAIAAKLVHPERKVVTVNGDGGFLMNSQELETAVRLQTPFVNVIWENQPVRLDRLEAGQEVRRALRHRLHQPRLREAGRGLRHAGLALRLGRRVRRAPAPGAALDVPSLIVLPIDYSLDVAISEELGTETVAT